jgi:hypothetical protein
VAARRVKFGVVAALLVGAVWLAVRPAFDPGDEGLAGHVTYVSLGDSVASGHGLGTTPDPKPGEQTYVAGVGCQRPAGDSYPNVVAAALKERATRVDHHQLACTGHTTADVLNFQLPGGTRAERRRPGGHHADRRANNYNFWEPAELPVRLYPTPAGFDQWRQPIEAGIRRDVAAILERLGRNRRGRLLLVTEYFNPFKAGAAVFELSAVCRDAAVCAARTSATIEGMNEAVRRGVADYDARRPSGWAPAVTVGGVAAAFREHAAPRPFCGSAAPDVIASWIQSPKIPALVNSLVGQLRVGPGNDCFHPNATGHRELDRLVVGALDDLTRRPGP